MLFQLQTLKFQIEPQIPYPIEQVICDGMVIRKLDDGTEMLAIAVTKELISAKLQAFEMADVSPQILTLDALALAAVLVVGWSATARFGSPLPARPAVMPGKMALIDNTASLLRFGGHGAAILRRYADATLRDVAQLVLEDARKSVVA